MQRRTPFGHVRIMFALLAFIGASCAVGGSTERAQPAREHVSFSGNVRDFELVAQVAQHEVVEGETVEVWGFNGQYPGPEIRVQEGDRLRVTVRNELPEATAVHWHGLEVPNDQDGVPNITQPPIEPGESFTYEFTVSKAGTTMYHTHANTVQQLARGLFGALIVEERDPLVATDHDRVLMLHEIDGLFTVNGYSFPKTLAEDALALERGESMRVRLVNVGQLHHPMHLHGHQFEVIERDSNPVAFPDRVNTIDMAPGRTADVVVHADNPGTWVFHCHVIPHVTTRGVYPGGMLTVLDYSDHTSYFEEQAAQGEVGADGEVPTEPGSEPVGAEATVGVTATDFAFEPQNLELQADLPTEIELTNSGAAEHNVVIEGHGFRVDAGAGSSAANTVTLPAGSYTFYCDIPGHRELGMEGRIEVR